MSWDYDIIIVGSGPAGSSVALNLMQTAPELARRAVLFEKGHHPRHKLCAGALVVDTEVCLRKLGLSAEDVPHVKVPFVHALFEGRGPKMRLDKQRAFRVCHRTEFDGWLVEKAKQRGVALQEDTAVLAVEPVEGGMLVKTNRGEVRARVVVGADGAKSTVRRAVVGHATDGGVRVARTIEVITEPPDSTVTPALWPQDDAVIDLQVLTERQIQGYVWDFPTLRAGELRRNRGVYDSRILPRTGAAPLPPALQADLEKAGQHLADYDVLGAPLRWYNPAGPFAAPGMLLVGDAAGTDALFGEGISSALAYGELAAASLRQAFASDDRSFADYPRRVRKSRMGRALLFRARTARLVFRVQSPVLQRILWWHLGPLARWYIVNWVFNWAR